MHGQPHVGFRPRAEPRFAALHYWALVIYTRAMGTPPRCTSAPASTCEVDLAAGLLSG